MPIKTELNRFPSKNYKTVFKPKLGTEISPKIAFNMIYRKPYFLCILVNTFLIKTLFLLELRTGNLATDFPKMGKNSKLNLLLVNQYFCHNLGHKKYKLLDVTKFILVLPTFRMIQQSLSRTKCSMKSAISKTEK